MMIDEIWKPVALDDGSLGTPIKTVGELKSLLKNVPDNYQLSVTGVEMGMLMDVGNEVLLIDEIPYLEELLERQ